MVVGRRYRQGQDEESEEITVVERFSYSVFTKKKKNLLGDFEGIIITDGYPGYNGLARAGPNGEKSKIRLASCWAHARRNFVDCEKDYPVHCKEAIDLIRKLYKIDEQAPDPYKLTDDERQNAFVMISKLREEFSRPVTKEIKAWAKAQLAIKESPFPGAVEYMLGHWKSLTVFLDYPAVPLDTNQIERGFRSPVVGRKNHYVSKSQRGTTVAAIFYSLIESAKLCAFSPKKYLLMATREALGNLARR